jgi:hypothetical protein
MKTVMNSLYGNQQIFLLAFLVQISVCLSEERTVSKKKCKETLQDGLLTGVPPAV